MGGFSNLGFDENSHKQYVNKKGDSQQSFQKNVEDMINNYQGQGGEFDGYEVAESTAALHPDYDSWYQLGKAELNKHKNY